jgi:hypothetical protein
MVVLLVSPESMNRWRGYAVVSKPGVQLLAMQKACQRSGWQFLFGCADAQIDLLEL